MYVNHVLQYATGRSCPKCYGKGTIGKGKGKNRKENACKQCDGTGTVPKGSKGASRPPLTLPEYLSDLDPWTGEPFDGTKTCWRHIVSESQLPEVVDPQGYQSILDAFGAPDSPYHAWWKQASEGARRSAEAQHESARPCPECEGTGKEEWEEQCKNCKGEGTVEQVIDRKIVASEDIPLGDKTLIRDEVEVTTRTVPCPQCRGKGLITKQKNCWKCSGSGHVKYTAKDVFYVELRPALLEKASKEFGYPRS
jgi:DnaJ-class molecular chaperone